MDTDLKAALEAVQRTASALDLATAAASNAQKNYDDAVATAQAAHASLTEYVAKLVPGIGRSPRVL